MRERRQRERQQRRRSILQAARRLFWAHGYAGTTVPGIAEAAELAPGTIYLYFESKDALYAELLIEGYNELLRRLEAQQAVAGSPRQRAAGLIEAFFAFARDCPEYFDIIFFVLQREAGGAKDEALEAKQIERLRAKEEECKRAAAQVMGPRMPAWAGDPVLLMDAVWSMLVGTIFYFRKRGAERLQAVEQQAKELLLRAAFGPAEAGGRG